MKSGMNHVIYIIEDYAGYDVTQSLDAIQTSISSSQTVNNFFVKRCKNIQETISYLLRMSKFLIKMHQVTTTQPVPGSLTIATWLNSDPRITNRFPHFLQFKNQSSTTKCLSCCAIRGFFGDCIKVGFVECWGCVFEDVDERERGFSGKGD